ncbi:DNA primase [Flavicella sediminum]|uniref:DNA primase n=1 Tax=Flavicella sediminum TaxID=2585141 RepID=UPI00111FCDB9|nr:DNA primase [Flavicella sediminum]
MIQRSTIDRVFETARVEEVIGEFVTLKKAGSNFKGLSPFTDEKSPSFMVSPVKQIWKDFSTGKGGNSVTFLMEHEHFSYPEAIRYLAKKYNIEIEEEEQTDEQKEAADERESMYLVSNFAKEYYHDILLNHPKGKAIGLSYFKERGFTDETIKKFELGYNLDDWSAFTDTAIRKGYDLNYLAKTGLSIVKDNNKQFDRFKGRVLFPIQSMSGRVLGFGGRILTADKKAAKYLNSPESDIYHKSKVLYGIYHAKQSIAKEDRCFLVEGYTDVISMNQAGVENVVASSGTALTPDQIRLIRRLTPNITVLFDGDAAGIRASIRGIDLILEQGMNVKVLIFPEGDDPDSFSKKVSKEELTEYLDVNAKDFINFKVSLLMEEAKNDPVKKAGLIRDIVTSISKIPDNIQREVYVQECSRIMDISETVLFNELAQIGKKNEREAYQKRQQEQKQQERQQQRLGTSSGTLKSGGEGEDQEAYFQARISQEGGAKGKNAGLQTSKEIDTLAILEREIIKILLLYGNTQVDFIDWLEEVNEFGKVVMVKDEYSNFVSQELYLQLQDDEIEFTNPHFQKIYLEIINRLNQEQSISIEQLTSHQDPDISQLVTDILMDDEKHILSDWEARDIYVTGKEEVLPKLVTDAILNLRRVLIELKIKELIVEISNPDNRESTLEMVVNYTELKKKLFEKLNRIL